MGALDDVTSAESTAIVADLDTGRPGPHVAFRFDLDALPIEESREHTHRPTKEGFASSVRGVMHACGHDAHTAIGLGVAEVLAALATEERLVGRFTLLFQPAEEGGRGGRSLAAGSGLGGVDALVCIHLGLMATGIDQLVAGAVDLLASIKLRASIVGVGAHAGLAPQDGRNALLAAASAALAVHTLAQSAQPGVRVNVGRLHAGEAPNIVPSSATLDLEARASDDVTLEELERRVRAAVEGSAAAFECSSSWTVLGRTASASSDPELADVVEVAASDLGLWDDVRRRAPFGASEDASWLMRSVQARGGRACYAVVGADVVGGHHTSTFDVSDQAVTRSVRLLAAVAARIGGPTT
ncbi:MAG: amidohydrolase [Trueperaceae bacterium]|nr:amidohydrolase [Trueperaceae bacterium]